MNKTEACRLLSDALIPYRDRSYADLQRLMRESESHEIEGASGARYAIKIYAFWDDRPHGDLRVIGNIDDGGWRAFAPLSDAFIVAPDGSFVGEEEGTEKLRVEPGRELLSLLRFSIGGGLSGLGLWCVLDWLYVKSAASISRGDDALLRWFPVALLAIALFHFRGHALAPRIALAMVGTLLACLAAIGLIALPGMWFHFWIGGRL